MDNIQTNDLKILNAAILNPENVAIIEDQLSDDSSVLSDTVGKPARKAALAAMLSKSNQKRRLRKRAHEIELVERTTGSGSGILAVGRIKFFEEGSEASECETGPECSICMEYFTNPVVCLLEL
jgi:hypothetical protein